jgi:4-hydroxybenzoate polyprenyltransferase
MALLKALGVGFVAFIVIALNVNSGTVALIGTALVVVVAYVYFKGVSSLARAAGGATIQGRPRLKSIIRCWSQS